MNELLRKHCHYLLKSYFDLLKKPLLPEAGTDGAYEAVYNAPFAILSHGTEEDPIFNFANLCAQELWNIPFDEFVRMPSRLSARPTDRTQRQVMMEEIALTGYIENYEGIRITKDQKLFKIQNVTIWNVSDDEGKYIGQAATFKDWEFLE